MFLYQVQGPNDFIFYFVSLFDEEIVKVVFIKYDCSKFLFLGHVTKIRKVALK